MGWCISPAGTHPARSRETSDDAWSVLALNLTGAFVAIRETLAVMDRDGMDRIVVIGSEGVAHEGAGERGIARCRRGGLSR